MHNTKPFTIKLLFLFFLLLGNFPLLEAQTTDENSSEELQTTSCGDEVTITYGNGTITLEGTLDESYTLQVRDKKNELIFECTQDCNAQSITELSDGRYRIIIRNDRNRKICNKWIELGYKEKEQDDDDHEDGEDEYEEDDDENDDNEKDGEDESEEEDDDDDDENDDENDSPKTGSGSGIGEITSICDRIQIINDAGMVTISGEIMNGLFIKINDEENDLAKVFSCKEDCDEEDLSIELPNSTYLLTLYNRNDRKLCSETFTITESSVEASALDRRTSHLSFSAHRDRRAVALQWLTNTGYKVSHFEVEHSVNGMDFTKIQLVNNGEWTDELSFFQVADNQPVMGDNYYRIKQVYVDDSFDYTPIQQINFVLDLDKTAVFPNPVQESLNINLKQYAGEKGVLKILNQFGQQVHQIDMDKIQEDLTTVNTAHLKNGVYYLSIQVGGYQVVSQKILVQRFY